MIHPKVILHNFKINKMKWDNQINTLLKINKKLTN